MQKKSISFIVVFLVFILSNASANSNNPSTSLKKSPQTFARSGWQKLNHFKAWFYRGSQYETDNIDGSKEVFVWTYWNAEHLSNNQMRSIKALVELDCGDRLAGGSNVTLFDLPDLGGHSIEQADIEMKAIEPETFYYVLYRRFCLNWYDRVIN